MQKPIYSAEEEQLLMARLWSPRLKDDPEAFVLFAFPWGQPHTPLERFKGLFMASFDAIEHRHAQVVIYQDEAKRLLSQPRFSYLEDLNKQQRKMWVDVLHQGIEEGYFRPDLDVDLVYRFIRDTTWVSVRWYQPGGPLTAEQVGQQYLAIVLGGITKAGD